MREFSIRFNWGVYEVWVKDLGTGTSYCLSSATTLDGAIQEAARLNGGPLTISMTSVPV